MFSKRANTPFSIIYIFKYMIFQRRQLEGFINSTYHERAKLSEKKDGAPLLSW